MPSRHQISCINKRQHFNPHERIEAIGGVNSDGTRWKLLEDEAIASVLTKKYAFFVIAGGVEAEVIVATHLGRRYLKTVADGIEPNNLLSLPECR